MTILFLIGLIVIIIALIILVILIFLKDLSEFIKKNRKCCKRFIVENKGFFTIFFILLFAFEQLVLILILNYLFDISKWIGVIIAIFALIVVTTATFQKFIWQYKFNYSEKMREGAKDAEDTIEEQQELISLLVGKIKNTNSKKK